MAQLVETVTGPTMADLRAARDAAVGDLVELRLDTVRDLDVAGALAGRRRPVIVTCRPRWEGGGFDGPETERLAILSRATSLGAEYIDLEFRAAWRDVMRGRGTKLVLSSHDFDGMPADLGQRVEAMRRSGADVVKIAAMATRLRDCVTLRGVVGAGGDGGGDHVAIAMGSAGEISRACPWLFRSCWMYGGSTAPGQIAARTLLDLYRIRATGDGTAIYAIGGQPLGHSASPAIHNAAFVALGIDAVFVRLETADAAEFLEVAGAFGIAGAAITAPVKSGFAPLGVTGDGDVARIGALNTLRRVGEGWEGRNFDVDGFLAPLQRRGHRLRDRRALVIGAGGAARAVSWALAREGAKVSVSARQADRAASVARDLDVAAVAWPPAGAWDLIVNATPVGTVNHPIANHPMRSADRPITDHPMDRRQVTAQVFYDLVYNPEETAWLAEARTRGAETIGGLEMLVAQACRQFEWWTGRTPPVAVMEAGARAGIQGAQAAA